MHEIFLPNNSVERVLDSLSLLELLSLVSLKICNLFKKNYLYYICASLCVCVCETGGGGDVCTLVFMYTSHIYTCGSQRSLPLFLFGSPPYFFEAGFLDEPGTH